MRCFNVYAYQSWVQGFLILIENLLWLNLETFMWLNVFLPMIENVLWLNLLWLIYKVLGLDWEFTLVNSENVNKLIENLHWLICKSITIINWTIIFRLPPMNLFWKSSRINLFSLLLFLSYFIFFQFYFFVPYFIWLTLLYSFYKN